MALQLQHAQSNIRLIVEGNFFCILNCFFFRQEEDEDEEDKEEEEEEDEKRVNNLKGKIKKGMIYVFNILLYVI